MLITESIANLLPFTRSNLNFITMKKSLFLFLAIPLILCGCGFLFNIDETTHTLVLQNESDIDISLQWNLNGEQQVQVIEAGNGRVSVGNIKFLNQEGDQNELEVDGIYEQFNELVLVIESNDDPSQEIELRTLQIDPFVASDSFFDTQEWYYTFNVTNDDLN